MDIFISSCLTGESLYVHFQGAFDEGKLLRFFVQNDFPQAAKRKAGLEYSNAALETLQKQQRPRISNPLFTSGCGLDGSGQVRRQQWRIATVLVLLRLMFTLLFVKLKFSPLIGLNCLQREHLFNAKYGFTLCDSNLFFIALNVLKWKQKVYLTASSLSPD